MNNSEIIGFEEEVRKYKLELGEVNSSLQNDPDNAQKIHHKATLEDVITELQGIIDELKPAPPPEQDASPHADPPKWSKENHPAFQPGFRKPGVPSSNVEEPQTPSSFKVNDTVLAKWVSGDKAFYPARITSITGSSAAPVYIVTFKSYGNSDTVRGNDIKPISNESKKRKADDSPATQSSPTVAANTGVISAAANINPDLASQVRKEPSKVSDGPPRPAKVPRKVKANKELEAGKNKWQEFTNKGKLAKTAKKESMFRTGESYNARVGFTGSGQAMRKDPSRAKHIYRSSHDEPE